MLQRKDIIKINREFRNKDESHLWPIKRKFTERAIKILRRLRKDHIIIDDFTAYRAILNELINSIINYEKNRDEIMKGKMK